MKKMWMVSIILLVLALAVMAVNWFVLPLPDWTVRTAGAAMLLALAGTGYSTARRRIEG